MTPPPAPDLSKAEPEAELTVEPEPVVPVANGGGDVPPTSPPPGTPESRSLAVILRELAAAPPGAGRFALIREARAHGLDVIEAHPDELAAIPEDLRTRLLRSPNGNGNGADASDREPAPQGSEIA
jgi:hypothetical protein